MSSRAELDQPTFPPAQFQSRVIADLYGFDPVNSVWRRMVLSPTGEIVVTVDLTPGTVITTSPDTLVPIAATVALPVPPANTRRMTVQNTGPAGTMVRVREVGGPAGSGIILVRFAQETYGGSDGSIAPLEVQEIAGIATTVAIQFERD
jgi:hypothetical protein